VILPNQNCCLEHQRKVVQIINLYNGEHALRNINNCLNTNIYSYLETSGGQSSHAYLNVVHFFSARDD